MSRPPSLIDTTVMRAYKRKPDSESNPIDSCPIRDYIRGYIIFVFLDRKPNIYDQQRVKQTVEQNIWQITWHQGLH